MRGGLAHLQIISLYPGTGTGPGPGLGAGISDIYKEERCMDKNPDRSEPRTVAAKKDDGTPKFGRLLIVLVIVVIAMGVLTWASEAYYS